MTNSSHSIELQNVNFHLLETATESNILSYMSTEKGLERALEQTSRFYSDLEHIATDLNTLSKRYSQSQTSMSPSLSKYYPRSGMNTIDALDWDWNDVCSPPLIQSPKNLHRKPYSSSSLSRLNNSTTKSKLRRKFQHSNHQTEYHESDLEVHSSRSYDCTHSPLRRRKNEEELISICSFCFGILGPSSVYFDSTDNTSGEENFADETLHIPSSTSVLNTSRTTEFFTSSK